MTDRIENSSDFSDFTFVLRLRKASFPGFGCLHGGVRDDDTVVELTGRRPRLRRSCYHHSGA